MATSKKTAKPRAPKKPVHYSADYIINPAHPVSVNVIGCGGTGSQVLNSLARMHSALIALGHPGLYIRAIDPDRVSVANMGRQLFSQADIDSHKCITLIGRINRFFGTDWEGVPQLYTAKSRIKAANITISCVDSGAARAQIKAALERVTSKHKNSKPYDSSAPEPYEIPYYWMDFGNMQDRGQVVLGTVQEISQPKSSEFKCIANLPTIDLLHPDILKDNKDDDQGPSCSLAEALNKQDLFINTNLANMGLGLLWKLFREARLQYHGLYLNLETMSVNPIKL